MWKLHELENILIRNQPEYDWHGYRVRLFGGTVIVECRMKIIRYQWAVHPSDGKV